MEKAFSNHLIAVVLIGTCMVSSGLLMSCSTAPKRESTGQYLDSSVITAKVKASLLADDLVGAQPITVTTYKNIVELSGFVDSRAHERRAIRLTQQVKGVAEVRSALLIKKR